MPEKRDVFFEREQTLAPDRRQEVENNITGRMKQPGCRHMLGSINGACIICTDRISVRKKYDHSIRKFVKPNEFIEGLPISFNVNEYKNIKEGVEDG